MEEEDKSMEWAESQHMFYASGDETDALELHELDKNRQLVHETEVKLQTGKENHVPQFTKRTIIKNVAICCLSFNFLFTAFGSVQKLQTSVNREEGIGSISVSLIYGSAILSCFLPKFLIARLGCKKTIAISMVGYILYMAANFYAIKATMFTAAILLGVGVSPLWSSQSSYLTQNSVWYARMTSQEKDVVISRFFGIFFFVIQTCTIWGNLLASMVLVPREDDVSYGQENVVCGARFCGNVSINFEQDKEHIDVLMGIYVGCALMALVTVIAFLDPITLEKGVEKNKDGRHKTTDSIDHNEMGVEQGDHLTKLDMIVNNNVNNDDEEERDDDEDRKLNPRLLLATFSHVVKSPIQKMLIPITLYGGIERAFVSGEYTKAYISCALGIWNLGFVMICYGVVAATTSYVSGFLAKYIGRIFFICFVFAVHLTTQVLLLLWEPSPDEQVLFYVYAGTWAIGDSVLLTQLNAMYGDVFTDQKEAAFSNLGLWEYIGASVAFGYNDVLCTDTKLYICLGMLSLGSLTFGAAEIRLQILRKKKKTIT